MAVHGAPERVGRVKWAGTGLLLSLSALVLGCGGEGGDGSPTTSEVHGRITVGGDPLPAGSRVSFTNDERGESFVAVVEEEGEYRYSPPSGTLEPGEYKVTVQPPPVPTIQVDGLDQPDPNAPDTSGVVPRKYRSPETTDLTATIGAGTAEFSADL